MSKPIRGDYRIEVTGIQKIDSEADKVVTQSWGTYTFDGGRCKISYSEFDEEDSGDFTNVYIEVNPVTQEVTMYRRGSVDGKLILNKGERHTCVYNTPAGIINMGIYTKTVDADFNENSGSLLIEYTVDFNMNLTTENQIIIKAAKAEE